jgi:hypothetical protein
LGYPPALPLKEDDRSQLLRVFPAPVSSRLSGWAKWQSFQPVHCYNVRV